MSNPSNLKYTASHEWVKTEADGTITIGITQHAQELLGDMVFVETPTVGRKLKAKEECAVVESVKAAADVYAPVSGVVTAVNSDLDTTPEDQYRSLWRMDVQDEARQSGGRSRADGCQGLSGTRGQRSTLKQAVDSV